MEEEEIPHQSMYVTGVLKEQMLAKNYNKIHNIAFPTANKINGMPSGGRSTAGGGSNQKTPLFETYSDWDREIKRTGASGWRVCSINEGYMISTW
jgi:hypothetical protein